MSEFVKPSEEIFNQITEIPIEGRIAEIEAAHGTIVKGSVRRIMAGEEGKRELVEISGLFAPDNLPLFFKAWRVVVSPEKEIYYLRHIHMGSTHHVQTRWSPHKPSAPRGMEESDAEYKEFFIKYNRDPAFRLFIMAIISAYGDPELIPRLKQNLSLV